MSFEHVKRAASLTLATLLPQRSRLSSESLQVMRAATVTESHRNYGESQIHWNCYSEIVTATTWPSEKVFGACISLQLLLVSLPTCCPQLWLNLSTALTSLTGDSTFGCPRWSSPRCILLSFLALKQVELKWIKEMPHHAVNLVTGSNKILQACGSVDGLWFPNLQESVQPKVTKSP